ncbi:MAG: hypothetical protein QM758_14070 [Armatimonas sp.]
MTRSIQQDRDFVQAILATRRSALPPEERIAIWRKLLSDYSSDSRSIPVFFRTRSRNLSYERSPYENITYISLGQDLEAVGRLDEALEAYWYARSHVGMAQVYKQLGQRENALASLQRAETTYRNAPETLLLEAEIHGEFGDYDEVTRLLKLAFCRTPENEHTPGIYQKIQEIGERFAVPLPMMLSS